MSPRPPPVLAVVLLIGCASKNAEVEPKLPNLTAGAGIACLETDHWYDCRLLDNFYQDYGQAAVPALPMKSLSFSMYDTCFLDLAGEATCIGANANHNDDVPGGVWTAISQGSGLACGLREDGTPECWGSAIEGWAAPTGPFIEIQANGFPACARRADGTIACWGYDYQGRVVSPAGAWASYILPGSYLCLLDDAGRITCAGDARVAGAAIPAGEGYHSLTGGFAHACALDAQNHAVCWGVDEQGLTDPPPDTFLQIAAGQYFTCGLREDGTVSCWGCREETTSNPEQYCNWDNPAPWWVP